MEYSKDKNFLRVTETITKETNYSLADLLFRKQIIVKDISTLQERLKEVETLIGEAEKLDIKLDNNI